MSIPPRLWTQVYRNFSSRFVSLVLEGSANPVVVRGLRVATKRKRYERRSINRFSFYAIVIFVLAGIALTVQ